MGHFEKPSLQQSIENLLKFDLKKITNEETVIAEMHIGSIVQNLEETPFDDTTEYEKESVRLFLEQLSKKDDLCNLFVNTCLRSEEGFTWLIDTFSSLDINIDNNEVSKEIKYKYSLLSLLKKSDNYGFTRDVNHFLSEQFSFDEFLKSPDSPLDQITVGFVMDGCGTIDGAIRNINHKTQIKFFEKMLEITGVSNRDEGFVIFLFKLKNIDLSCVFREKMFENGSFFRDFLKYGSNLGFNMAPTQLKTCLDSYLVYCLQHDRPHSIELLEAIYTKQGIEKTIPQELTEQYERLSKLTSKDFFERVLSEFALAPTYKSRITPKGAMVLLAATHEKKLKGNKSYTFNPTIFEKNEFNQYLTALQDSKKRPIDEKFIITSGHWVSGQVSINEDGIVNIFIDEPLANKSFQDSFVKEIKKSFLEKQVNIYFQYHKKQNSATGCKLFALDSLKHYFNETKFLGNNASGEPYLDVFSYLKDHVKQTFKYDNLSVFLSDIHPRAMRPAQTSQLETNLKYGIDPSTIVNTKNQSFSESYGGSLLTKTDGSGKINTWLIKKMNIMYEDLKSYLYGIFEKQHTAQLENPTATEPSLEDQCKLNVQQFSLKGLYERLAQEELLAYCNPILNLDETTPLNPPNPKQLPSPSSSPKL